MRIISENETKDWLRHQGLLDSEDNLSFSTYVMVASHLTPKDSGAKTSLARFIMRFFKEDTEALLWINEFKIWPSAEDWNLFDGFRKSLGETSCLYDKPGHLFSKDDAKTVTSILGMVLYFIWGAILVSTSRKLIVEISHDEWIDIFAKDEEGISKEEIKELDSWMERTSTGKKLS